VIREATDNDIEQIVSIYNHYILNSVATFEEAEINVSEMAGRIHKVKNDGLPWLVAVENDEVIGYAYAGKWNNRAAYRYTAEVTIYLLHAVVSKGVGTKLYDELFSRLHGLGIHVVIGGITLPNPASIAIHEKFGMKRVGLFTEVGYKFGKWLDVGYWETQLNA